MISKHTTIHEVGCWDDLEKKVERGEFPQPDQIISYEHGGYYDQSHRLGSELYYVFFGKEVWISSNEDTSTFAVWNSDPTGEHDAQKT